MPPFPTLHTRSSTDMACLSGLLLLIPKLLGSDLSVPTWVWLSVLRIWVLIFCCFLRIHRGQRMHSSSLKERKLNVWIVCIGDETKGEARWFHIPEFSISRKQLPSCRLGRTEGKM
jgi:hypothetical protein